jgi:5-methylcytosine-specific restriction endonuclease McrA
MRRNPEKAREAMRRWRQNHRDEHNAERRSYRASHRAAESEYFRAYRQANPEIRRINYQRYRARKMAAVGKYTTAEWLALRAAFREFCAYCGEPGPLQVEHRIPLSRGGTNDISNILPACARCNTRKHRMTDEEFRRRLGQERRDGRIGEDAAPYLIECHRLQFTSPAG